MEPIRTRHTGLGLLALLSLLAGPTLGQDDDAGLFRDPRILDPIELEGLSLAGGHSLPIIVSLHEPPAMAAFRDWRVRLLAEEHRAEVSVLLDQALSILPPSEFEPGHRLENEPIFAGRTTVSGLRSLLANPQVRTIELDREVRAHSDQAITLMNADAVRSTYDGSGLSIAIVDTGIDYNHEALGGGEFPNAKVIGGRDFGDNDNDPLDQHGHGTSVAGCAAGDVVNSGDYVGGVAPGARLYALKIVFGNSGSASSANIMAAWDWCVTHQDDDPANPIRLINTSFGGGQNMVTCGGGYEATAQNAVAAGITVFCSSGNDGYCNAMGSPACAPTAISVGAVYDANIGAEGWCVQPASCVTAPNPLCLTNVQCFDATTAADQVTCYSNSAFFLDLLGPSHDATVPSLGGGYTNTFGGTSAATPFAAGAAALLLDAAQDAGVALTPADIRDLLVATGDPVTDPKAALTFPRVNLGDAVATLEGTWVDFSYDGPELGTFLRPFDTLAEGVAAVSPGNSLRIVSGVTAETPTITKALSAEAHGGAVTIGD